MASPILPSNLSPHRPHNFFAMHITTTTNQRAAHLPQTLSIDHVSPATRLLEKRRQMFEVQEALDAQKEEFARREVR
jgi:hypothetical protein